MSREVVRAFFNERRHEPMLEIGPLINPFLTKDEYNVYYSDVKSKDEIYEEYRNDPSLRSEEDLYSRIAPIDFVVKETYLKAVGEKRFSVIFSSHVIEHTQDIIRYLLELSEILMDGGYIVLYVPDKRYCFDHFREVTPFRDALDVYLSNDTRSTARFVFDHVFCINPCNDMMKYHNDEVSFNNAEDGEARYADALNWYRKKQDGGEHSHLIHYWIFTYVSFLGLIRDCLRANLIPYGFHMSYPTLYGQNEFCVMLQKDKALLGDRQKRKSEVNKITAVIEEHTRLTSKESVEIQAIRASLQAQHQELQAIMNSTSWRITKPLRAIKRIFTTEKKGK